MGNFLSLYINELLKVVLALIMLSVGLTLRRDDFRYVFNNGYLLLVGLFVKMLLLPLLSLGLVLILPLSAELRLGILLLMITPGGTTSNLITYWFGGTAVLTILLTLLASLLAIVTIPLFLFGFSTLLLGQGASVSLSVVDTLQQLLVVVVLPVTLGMLWRRYGSKSALKVERWLKLVSAGLLGLVYLYKFLAPVDAGGAGFGADTVGLLLPVLLGINVAGLFLGFWLAKRLQLQHRDALTIGIEMGIQNPGLALYIGTVLLNAPLLGQPALLYGMFSFWTTLAFGYWGSRMGGR